jgi:hypothetical protein
VNVLTDKRDSTLRFNELDSIPNHPFLINIHAPICHVSATSSEEQTRNESKEHFPQPSFVNANTELRTNLKELNNYTSKLSNLITILIMVQRNATGCSLFYFTVKNTICFGCQQHPSSGVYKTVITASGTGRNICTAT